MTMWFGLVCLLWAVGAWAECGVGGAWYGGDRLSTLDEYPSYEDRSPSFEDASDEYYPVKRQRSLRASRYTAPTQVHGNDFRSDGGDWEQYGVTGRKSHYDAHKSRRKYGAVGKRSRTEYSVKGSLDANVYERKKTSRAAKYSGDSAPYGKTTSLTFKAVPPKANCAQNLLIGCTPTVTRVPCSGSAPYEAYGHSAGMPYYPPAPVYHQHHAAVPEAHYGMSHPAPYGGYGPSPPSYGSAAYHHGAPGGEHYPKPAHDGPHGYGPSYKAATAEEMPGFAAPVREDLSESTKVPIISAFQKPTDSSSPVPTAAGSSKGAQHNGTLEHETASTTVNPIPMLTPAPEQKEDNDAFWGVESNVESSTDVTEGSTAR